jgi:hypothetical protein
MRKCQTIGPVLATRSPGLGNVDNLKEVCICNFVDISWLIELLCNEVHLDSVSYFTLVCRVQASLGNSAVRLLMTVKYSLNVWDVHKSFGDKHVLRGVSFKVWSSFLFIAIIT